MDDLSAIILVGGRGSRLKGLTRYNSKPYISFFGKYRIIDFPLSSVSNSLIKQVGILTQHEPYELMKYIGSGESFDLDIDNYGVTYLTPYEKINQELALQKGTAQALYTQIENIKKMDSKYVLVLSGDQIYKIDFNEVLKYHIKKKADLTIITKDLDSEKEDLTRFGIIEYDSINRITSLEEKPDNPKSNHISLGMYLFTKEYLLKVLPLTEEYPDFGSSFIPYLIKSGDKVFSYKTDSIFMDLGTVSSLYNANMYFLDHYNLINSKGDQFKIYSKGYNYPPFLVYSKAKVTSSSISDGAIIKGNVTHSVISYMVKIDAQTEIVDSVLLPSSVVKKGSKLKNVILDEDTIVPPNSSLIFDKPTLIDSSYFRRES